MQGIVIYLNSFATGAIISTLGGYLTKRVRVERKKKVILVTVLLDIALLGVMWITEIVYDDSADIWFMIPNAFAWFFFAYAGYVAREEQMKTARRRRRRHNWEARRR